MKIRPDLENIILPRITYLLFTFFFFFFQISNSLFSQFYIGKQHEKYIHKFVKHLIVVLNMKFV